MANNVSVGHGGLIFYRAKCAPQLLGGFSSWPKFLNADTQYAGERHQLVFFGSVFDGYLNQTFHFFWIVQNFLTSTLSEPKNQGFVKESIRKKGRILSPGTG